MTIFKPQLRGFHELQPYHVQEILLVSSLYDAFIFEEDGQLTERIFSEYSDFHLHYAPRVTQVASAEKALQMLKETEYDMLITTLQLEDVNVIEFCKKIKREYPHIKTILLSHAPQRLPHFTKEELTKTFDGVFAWNGDTKIFLAIIKLIEDKLNVKHDTELANVRVILVVEDSVKNYSSFLTLLYYEIMNQTRSLISGSSNREKKIFRMRTRPKVLLATNYEDALKICEEYKDYMIGLISDIRFPKNDVIEPEAGFELIKNAKEIIPDLPVILHSNEPHHRARVNSIGASFIDKNSPTLLHELSDFFRRDLGFGDFVFRLPNGHVVATASDMVSLEEKLKSIPDESLKYHAQRNHFSIWLMARGEFILANELRPRKIEDFGSIEILRRDLIRSLSASRFKSQQGVIADFSCDRFNPECNFSRIGNGSLGGKARGIGFINALLAQKQSLDLKKKYPDIEIGVPYTVVIGTDEFDRFVTGNNLTRFALEENNDKVIAQRFLEAKIADDLRESLLLLLQHIEYPLAIRSSSLLEDSHAQPFAGIYSTYMLPNCHPDINVRLEYVLKSIKLIYASVYYQAAKAYLSATSNRIEEEKMGILIQQIVGKKYDDLFYPDFSGVARDLNFFPISHMKREDGIAYVALGLGKAIMEGQNVLQFSPKHPDILPQLTEGNLPMKNTQKEFYAINLANPEPSFLFDEDATLKKENLARAEKDGTLDYLGSTYVAENDMIKDGIHHQGMKFVSFAHILKSNVFPLASLLCDIIDLGKNGIGSSVEIEFAVQLAKSSKEKHKFYLLQIRPMIVGKEQTDVDLRNVKDEEILCRSNHTLGNGIIKGIKDIIYVRPKNFDASKTPNIADEIGKINSGIKTDAAFIGLGRWGTADPWLGIPVNWSQISRAKVLIEVALETFNIEPSHGTHFFHNITTLNIGYLTIPTGNYGDFVDWDWLEAQPAAYESQYVRHVRLENPIEVILNGRKGKGVILKV